MSRFDFELSSAEHTAESSFVEESAKRVRSQQANLRRPDPICWPAPMQLSLARPANRQNRTINHEICCPLVSATSSTDLLPSQGSPHWNGESHFQ